MLVRLFLQDIVFETDHQAALQLTNIISGRYKFILEVTDEEGLSSTDVVSLIVRPGVLIRCFWTVRSNKNSFLTF